MVQWPLIMILVLFSFASLYRFGPNLKDRRWQWSVPGAVVATTLWITSTLLLRVYDEQFSSYQRIYGPLKPAAVFLLWLYFTGAAILVGGEANSEIEKAAAEARHADVRRPEDDAVAGLLRRPIQCEVNLHLRRMDLGPGVTHSRTTGSNHADGYDC
jgi:uncharacterized BrkB/YihY/UPF0761 family membrane protein